MSGLTVLLGVLSGVLRRNKRNRLPLPIRVVHGRGASILVTIHRHPIGKGFIQLVPAQEIRLPELPDEEDLPVVALGVKVGQSPTSVLENPAKVADFLLVRLQSPLVVTNLASKSVDGLFDLRGAEFSCDHR